MWQMYPYNTQPKCKPPNTAFIILATTTQQDLVIITL